MRSAEEKQERLEQYRAQLAERKASGLCTVCGEQPASDGKRTCQACRTVNVQKEQRYRAKLGALGVCACGKPVTTGKKHCAECLARAVQRVVEWRKNNPEHAMALRRKEWEQAGPEKIAKLIEFGKKWKSANPDRIRAYNAQWRKDHTERLRELAQKRRTQYGTRWAKYRLSDIEFMAMFRDQGDCCAICRQPVDATKVNLDHDHSFKRADKRGHRGILCFGCNVRLGYVEKWKCPPSEAERSYLHSFQRRLQVAS